MKVIIFTIKGNQENPNGNPIPYLRTTQRSQWTDKAKRYNAWKDYVRASYLDQVVMKMLTKDFVKLHDITKRKPIVKSKEKIHVKIEITFYNKAHADSDNIFKGIADALFMDDKYLSGEFDYKYGKSGKVKVAIIWTGKN